MGWPQVKRRHEKICSSTKNMFFKFGEVPSYPLAKSLTEVLKKTDCQCVRACSILFNNIIFPSPYINAFKLTIFKLLPPSITLLWLFHSWALLWFPSTFWSKSIFVPESFIRDKQNPAISKLLNNFFHLRPQLNNQCWHSPHPSAVGAI